MADWKSFEIQVPGKDLLEPVRNVLETILVFLDVLKAILDTIKVFLVDFGNPIRALVEELIKLIEELFLALKRTGFFAYFDVPDPLQDPNFNRFVGGFEAFTERFKASLFDSKDFNRPQPRTGSTKSGFVLLVVDASSPYALVERIKQLLRFFGKEFTSPRYEAPNNVKALPVGDAGDPILAVATLFSSGPIKAIELQWTLPTSAQTPDPGFSDVVTQMAAEFVPPQWLIERSTINPSFGKIDLSEALDVEKVGAIEFDRETDFEVGGQPGQRVKRREPLIDDQGDPVIKFQKYEVISPTDVTGLLGELGRFRYIDTDVETDTTYYYRVRAFSGDLDLSNNSDKTSPLLPTDPSQLETPLGGNRPVMRWPSTSADSVIVMGKPSGIISASVPYLTDPGDFDVIEDLKRIFQLAFAYDFHQPLASDATFDDQGNPTNFTSPLQVGRGSLLNLGSPLAAFESIPVVNLLTGTGNSVAESFKPDDITGKLPEMPWQKYAVMKQSARLADATATAFLEAGQSAVLGFRSLMQDALPKGPIDMTGWKNTSLSTKTTLEQFVVAMTDQSVDLALAQNYVDSYYTTTARQNVLAAINYIKTFTLGGVPPDWISVVPLRDIVPWSGQIVYDLLDKIQALLDAFKGVIDEINAFIALLERKIDALERFIEFLINILTLIENLQIGAYLLNVPELNGDAFSWVDAIDTAGGAAPPKLPGNYSAGVGLAYVAIDISAFKTAFQIIFGA